MAKLGSDKRPLMLRVRTQSRGAEMLALCEERGWKAVVGVEPDEPEDVSDLERLLKPPSPVVAEEKIGSNAPCPCGSGKKYKRCCMGKETEAEEQSAAGEDWEEEPRIGRLAVSRIIEEARNQPALFKKLKKGFRKFHPGESFEDFDAARWNQAKVRAMSTEDIIAKLKSLNVAFDRERFTAQAKRCVSAIQLAEERYYPPDYDLLGLDEDFIWMAIIELWKRFMPERACMEMIDDAMQEGYQLIGEDDYPAAMHAWDETWRLIKALIPDRIKSIEEADDFLPEPITQGMSEWSGDYETELGSAGMHQQRIVYCREFCARFPSSEDRCHGMRRAEAESLAVLGNMAEADAIFKNLTERYPDNIWGYIGWGDIYSGLFYMGAPDRSKAEAIYNMGLKMCEGDEHIDLIHDRLMELRGERVKRRRRFWLPQSIRNLFLRRSG